LSDFIITHTSKSTGQENYAQTREFFYESLQLAQDLKDPTLQVSIIVGILYFLVNFYSTSDVPILKLANRWLGAITQWLTGNNIKLTAPSNIYYEQCSQLLQDNLGSLFSLEPAFVAEQPESIEQLAEEILKSLPLCAATKCS
jgi:hypothetical protein